MEPVRTLFSATPRPAVASRHGHSWEASDYDLLVEGIRQGLDVPALAERLGRVERTVYPRVRRLLPLAQRDCLPELVLSAARTALQDTEYDWRSEMLLTPAPAPIVRNEIVHTGLAGLTNEQLVPIGYALMAVSGELQEEPLAGVVRELDERGLQPDLIELRAHLSVRASPQPISEGAAWASAMYWVTGRSNVTRWRNQAEW